MQSIDHGMIKWPKTFVIFVERYSTSIWKCWSIVQVSKCITCLMEARELNCTHFQLVTRILVRQLIAWSVISVSKIRKLSNNTVVIQSQTILDFNFKPWLIFEDLNLFERCFWYTWNDNEVFVCCKYYSDILLLNYLVL